MSYQQPYPGPTPNYNHLYGPTPRYGADFKSPWDMYKSNAKSYAKNKIKKLTFPVLFIAQLLGYVAISGVVLKTWIDEGGLGGGLGEGGVKFFGVPVILNRSAVYLLLLVTAAAVLLSSLYLMLARAFTKIIMHITLVLTILLNIGICIYFWITKYYSGAIIFTIIAILSVVSYFGFRARIPLAARLFQVVMDVSKHHISVYAVAFSALILTASLFDIWHTSTLAATYAKWTPGSPSCATTSCSYGKVVGLIFLETVLYNWTSQNISNFALATLAGGPYGCWYYFEPRSADRVRSDNQDLLYDLWFKHPTVLGFGRVFTLPLGSISFRNLIVTILGMFQLVLNAAANNASMEGNFVEACLARCATYSIEFIESSVEHLNRYACIEIALKDTRRLLKDRRIDALVNNSLVGMTLMWGAYAVGLLSLLFCYLYLRITQPSYNSDGQFTPILLVFAFFIGMMCASTLVSAIDAGVSTIFVGLGEDPAVLAVRAPELFALIAQVHPHVMQGVPH